MFGFGFPGNLQSTNAYTIHCVGITDLDWFSPHDCEVLSSLHHETGELMAQNLLDLISL